MPQLIAKEFDYGPLGESARIAVQQKTAEIRSRMNKAARNIIEIGERLIAVKEQLPHGQFRHWLKAEFGWGKTTAHRMMKVATTFKCPNLDHLTVSPSALYRLASDNTPQEVRDQFIHNAQDGKTVTYAEVKEAVRRAVEPEIAAEAQHKEDDAPKTTKRIGKGVSLAYDAIAILRKIRDNDPLRAEGLKIVAQWIERFK